MTDQQTQSSFTATLAPTGRTQDALEAALRQELPLGTVQSREGAKWKNPTTGKWEPQIWEYIEHEYVRQQLVDLFGLDYSNELTLVHQLSGSSKTDQGTTQHRAMAAVKVRLAVLIKDNGVVKTVIREAFGAHTSFDKNPESAFDKAIKAAESDGWKRVGLTFGKRLGLGLEKSGGDAADETSVESPRERKAQAAEPEEKPAHLRAAETQTVSTATTPQKPPVAQSTVDAQAKSSAPATTTATATAPAQDDVTRDQFRECGFDGPILERLMAYPATDKMSQEQMAKAYGMIAKQVGNATAQSALAEAKITKGELPTGKQYRLFVYLASKQAMAGASL